MRAGSNPIHTRLLAATPVLVFVGALAACRVRAGDPVTRIDEFDVTWTIETVAAGDQAAVAVESGGVPHLCYRSESPQGLIHAWKSGSVWTSEVALAYRGFHPRLALDGNGVPKICCFDLGSRDLLYVWRDGAVWREEAVDRGAVGERCSLVLDAGGRPHVSYYDNGDQKWNLQYAHHDGTNWQHETADSVGDVGSHSSLALDGDGRPRIAYYDASNRSLKYAWRDGDGWHVATADGTAGVGRFPSLVAGRSGEPCIAYFDSDHWSLRFARRLGGEWIVSTRDAQGGWYSALAAGADDALWTAHAHLGDTGVVKFAWSRAPGDTWKSTVLDRGGVIQYAGVAVDASGARHVCYVSDLAVKYARGEGVPLQGEWQIQRIVTNGGSHTSLALDVAGRPRIAFCGTGPSGGYLGFLQYDGVEWRAEPVDTNGNVGAFNSLALDASGRPCISYVDQTRGALKYANHDGTSWRIQVVDSDHVLSRATDLTLAAPDGQPRVVYLGLDGMSVSLIRAWYDTAAGVWRRSAPELALDATWASIAWSAALGVETIACNPPVGADGSSLQYFWFQGGAGVQWAVDRLDLSPGVGAFCSLAVDASANPRIAHYDAVNRDLKFARRDATGWLREVVDSLGDAGKYSSLALDRAGVPMIAYQNATWGNLMLARHDAVRWSLEAIHTRGAGAAVGLYAALAADPLGRPNIAYATESGEIWYARPTLWAGALRVGGRWRYLDWFGWFADVGGGWLYHAEHGWTYGLGDMPGSVWLYTLDMGWLWSGAQVYPWMWRASDRAWLYYYRGTAPRAFWNAVTGQVEWL